jgi:hypothetical protein
MSGFQQPQGFGQMIPQQQQQRQQQQPQRPPGNQNPTSIQQLIYNTLNAQTGALNGWQANVLIQERMSLVLNM